MSDMLTALSRRFMSSPGASSRDDAIRAPTGVGAGGASGARPRVFHFHALQSICKSSAFAHVLSTMFAKSSRGVTSVLISAARPFSIVLGRSWETSARPPRRPTQCSFIIIRIMIQTVDLVRTCGILRCCQDLLLRQELLLTQRVEARRNEPGRQVSARMDFSKSPLCTFKIGLGTRLMAERPLAVRRRLDRTRYCPFRN